MEDPISHELLYPTAHVETSDSAVALHSSSTTSSQKNLQHYELNKIDQTVKKHNHNASERDRRKKINGLYSSLRSLLPPSDHTKKLSIPSTVSRILKYIPELQSEVERLIQKKEEFTISNRENSADFNKQRRRRRGGGGIDENSSLVISASEIGDEEIMVQICTLKNNRSSIGEAISELEDEGLVLLNSSSFETCQDRIFYTLHFQVFIKYPFNLFLLLESPKNIVRMCVVSFKSECNHIFRGIEQHNL
ncbi:hypothetical protein HAX54_002879 [Datura stramonium]|uniref:BHLH domain-containing protein n=1 Tax=Datura stramonium TaxID=4076 RepID=A0ABS8WWJ8_DATST|nr:hypothetical protein [Datura stramonium]